MEYSIEKRRKLNGCGKIVLGVFMVRILEDGKPVTKWAETNNAEEYFANWLKEREK